MFIQNKIKQEVLDKEAKRKDIPWEDRPELEKGDILAMIISGFLTVGIPCIVAILLIAGVMLLLFGGNY